MEAGHITPRASQPDRDIAFYEQQHEHDLDVIDRQADRIANLERERDILILQARRDLRG